MNDGTRALEVVVAGVVQAAGGLNPAENPIGPDLVLVVDTLAEGQSLQKAPAVELGADTDEKILRQETPEALPPGEYPGFRFFANVPGKGGGAVRGQKAALDHICTGFSEGGQHPFDKLCVAPVVAVHKADKFAGGALQTVVSGVGETAVGLVKDPDPRIPALPSVAKCPGAIGGAVVDQEDLEILMGLLHQTVQTPVQILGNIINRHNDRNQIIHFRFLPTTEGAGTPDCCKDRHSDPLDILLHIISHERIVRNCFLGIFYKNPGDAREQTADAETQDFGCGFRI